jgi:hypothetical protein
MVGIKRGKKELPSKRRVQKKREKKKRKKTEGNKKIARDMTVGWVLQSHRDPCSSKSWRTIKTIP